jgi:hypothetical protein
MPASADRDISFEEMDIPQRKKYFLKGYFS